MRRSHIAAKPSTSGTWLLGDKSPYHSLRPPIADAKRDGISGNGTSLSSGFTCWLIQSPLPSCGYSTATAAPQSITTPITSRKACMKGICEINPNATRATPMSVNITAFRECAFGAKAVRFLFRWTKAWTDLISLWQASLHANPTPVSLAHCEHTPRKQNLHVPTASF
jgi:hypothetical protein